MNAILQPKINLAAACDPVIRWVTVTPELAADMLKRNTLNRPKKLQKIKLYAQSMREGRWPVTGSPLQFGKTGRLVDGQNRLQAIIDSGITLRMLVVEGIDESTFDVIDSGAKRSSSDVLVMLGYEGWIAATGAAASTIAFNLKGGHMPFSYQLSAQSVREFVEESPELMQSVEFLSELPRKGAPLPHAAAAALHYIMAKSSAAAADRYMQQLFVGNDMQAGDMVLKLRNHLMAREASGTVRNKNGRTQTIGAVIKVWNSQRAGRNIAHINNAFPRSDETFPKVA